MGGSWQQASARLMDGDVGGGGGRAGDREEARLCLGQRQGTPGQRLGHEGLVVRGDADRHVPERGLASNGEKGAKEGALRRGGRGAVSVEGACAGVRVPPLSSALTSGPSSFVRSMRMERSRLVDPAVARGALAARGGSHDLGGHDGDPARRRALAAACRIMRDANFDDGCGERTRSVATANLEERGSTGQREVTVPRNRFAALHNP